MLNKQITKYVTIITFSVLALMGFNVGNSSANLTIYEVPPLDDMVSSAIYGINNSGVVCGKSYTTNGDDIAISWHVSGESTAFRSLASGSESSCWDINDNGQASGFSRSVDGAKCAVRWDDSSSITDLGVLANPDSDYVGVNSDAFGIGNEGMVIGFAEIPNINGETVVFHAVKSNGNSFIDLGTLNGSNSEYQYGYSIAYDFNNFGETVGIAHDDSFNFRPFIHDSQGGMMELQTDPSYPDGEWYASVINDSDLIGGHVITSDNHVIPYYWNCRNCSPEKIALPDEFPNGEIYAINNLGQMVGMMWSDDDEPIEHAFIFDVVFGVRDLNSFVSSDSGWLLTFARDINDSGQIAGTGIFQGNKRGYMLDSLNLTKPGDYTNDGSVDLGDVILGLRVLTQSSTSKLNLYADINNDNRLGLTDLIYVLNTVSTN